MNQIVPLLSVLLDNEQGVVLARQRARQIAELLGFDAADVVRVATAVSEVARNAVCYGSGGWVEFSCATDDPPRLRIVVRDRGKDPVDVAHLLDSTVAGAEGLVACRRLMDDFDLESPPAGGLSVAFSKHLRNGHRRVTPQKLQRIAHELRLVPDRDPIAEVQRQNRELLQALAEAQKLQQQLAQLNRELQDTNRGVMALYAELDERADSLRRASEAKTRFLSSMTHEFRSPLNSILSLARMLAERMDGDLNAEQMKQVQFVHKAATDLSELVNDLLDLARVEAGKVSVRLSEFSLADVLSTLRGTTRPLMAAQPEVALVFDEPACDLILQTDEGKLAQILRNLISNAIKFTERGEVRVSTERVDATEIVFHVSDTGVGIAHADHERIFEEFAQVEHPIQRRVKGTGLGLPLARRLTQLLGGSIALRSELGRGSVFSVTLPVRYSGPLDVVVAPPSTPPAQLLAAAESPLALVVDDDEISRYLLRTVLEPLGFQVVEADGAESCFGALKTTQPSVLVLDVVMPGLNGLIVLDRVRGDAGRPDLPVILHTAAPLTEADRGFAEARHAIIVTKQFGQRERWEADLRNALQLAGLSLSTPV